MDSNSQENGDLPTKKSLRSASCSLPDLSGGQQKMASGRTTPSSVCSTNGRQLSLADYEHQLDKYQKENFNLKTRIWTLEMEYSRKGGITADDTGMQDYEAQITELTARLEEKDRMLKESLDVLAQLKANCNRELIDFRREHEAEMDRVRSQFTERINALEEVIRSANEQLQSLENENVRLNQLVDSFQDGKHPMDGESDSDISLLSQRDQLIFELKTRIATLERERSMPLSSPNAVMADLGILNISKFWTPPTGTPNRHSNGELGETLNFEEIELESIKAELKEKEDLLANVHAQIDDRDNFIDKLKGQIDEKDTMNRQMQKAIVDRDQYIVTLESNLSDKNECIGNLESENENLKRRLDDVIENNRKAINNSDDEKLRHLEEELLMERMNAGKHIRIIRGLINQIEKERRRATIDQTNDVALAGIEQFVEANGAGDFEQLEETDADSATLIAWLNETSKLQFREHDNYFRRQMAELQTVRDTLEARLSKVADTLGEYAQKLQPTGNNMDSVLSGISNEISSLRRDLHESLPNATYAIAAACAGRGVDKSNGTSLDISRIQAQFEERPDLSHWNLSNLSHLSDIRSLADGHRQTVSKHIQVESANRSIQTEPVCPIPTSDAAVSASMDESSKIDPKYVESIMREKEKYERYAKALKAKYRQALKFTYSDEKAVLEECLAKEKQLCETVEGIVRRVEENNQILGERLQSHEHQDKKLKDAVKKGAIKVKELKRQLRGAEGVKKE